MSDHVCKICGAQVSKRQSLAYGDGRACRSHSEAQQETAAKLESERAQQRQQEEKRNRRHQPREPLSPMIPRCWKCHTTGISQKEFYFRMLIEMEKTQQRHTVLGDSINFFEMMNETRAAIKEPVLLLVPVPDDRINFISRMCGEMGIGVDITKHACLCGTCCKELNLKPAEMPEITKEQLTTGMVASAIMHPAIEEIAKAEIREESLQN